jgi:hypothetical protein
VRRWLAFRRKQEKKRQYLYSIADLRRPTVDGRPGLPLFTPDELRNLEGDSKGRFISRYYEETVDLDDPETKKSYQGQWRTIRGHKCKDGLGVLIWQDGSKYQG